MMTESANVTAIGENRGYSYVSLGETAYVSMKDEISKYITSDFTREKMIDANK